MRRGLIILFLLFCAGITVLAQTAPKREFRGAWIQAVNHQFEGIPTAELKAELASQVETLSDCGITTVLFQIRVEGDALYKSELEPWSAYLTGRQGKSPDEDWDPLQYMIDICHAHGMELHAWINPYRACTASTKILAPTHQMSLHPERFVKYGDLVLFNPALQENRDYICSVAADIVTRYDIDGFHIDDYFYPYPENGLEFNDRADFLRDPRGFDNRDDWRRDNVNLFVEQLFRTVTELKPWVKFGISPFGIYRNASESCPDGSDTNGLENYSGLYADVMYWLEKGWMDYCIPQIYWNVGYKVADYEILANWWAQHSNGCLMYVGQDVERTVKGTSPDNAADHQERYKMNLQRSMLDGSCHWPAKSVVDNPGHYRDILATEYYQKPALQPVPQRMNLKPRKVRRMRVVPTSTGNVLFWTPPTAKSAAEQATRYVVYRFESGEKVNIDDASHILCVTDRTYLPLDDSQDAAGCTYVVTSLTRVQAESKPVRCKVKSHIPAAAGTKE